MAYSKSYQEVIAGRVREDEVSFYGRNHVAVGSGKSVSIVAMGGKKQPTIQQAPLEDEAVGKAEGRNRLHVYLPNSDQTGVF